MLPTGHGEMVATSAVPCCDAATCGGVRAAPMITMVVLLLLSLAVLARASRSVGLVVPLVHFGVRVSFGCVCVRVCRERLGSLRANFSKCGGERIMKNKTVAAKHRSSGIAAAAP